MKTILFDFDGTIADTLSVLIEIANEVMEEMGRQPLSPQQIEHYRGMTIMQIKDELQIPATKIPSLVAKARKKLFGYRDELQPIPQILDVIQALRDKNVTVGMLTSNSKKNVDYFLHRHKANDLFDFVYTGSSLFGKTRMIKKIIKKYDLDGKKLIYVGDEVRDVTTAKKANVAVASVTWGFNSESILRQHSPDVVITKPKQLLNLVNKQ